jgi:hypothetical protein
VRKLLTLLAAALAVVAASAAVAVADSGPATPAQATVHLGGTIAGVGSGSISLKVEKAGKHASSLVGQTVSIGIDGDTHITTGKSAGGIGDLVVGARAAVAAKGFPDSLVATRIHAAKGSSHVAARHFGGAVLAVGSNSLTLKVDRTGKHDSERMGQTITVSVPAGTPIVLGKKKTAIALSDIQVGWRAGVAARQDGSSWTAARVHAWRGNHWFAGEVTAVGSSSLTVAVKRTGKHDTQLKGTTVTVQVDSSTQIVRGKDKTPISLGDVKVGDRVGVVVHSPGGDLSLGMTAVRIHDHPKQD